MSLLKQDAGACRRETLRGLGLSGFPGTGSTLAGGCKGLRQPRASSQRPGPESGTGGGGASERDVVLIQRQQQQDGPAAQQAHVVQQEEEPWPLVPHVQHGRELRKR